MFLSRPLRLIVHENGTLELDGFTHEDFTALATKVMGAWPPYTNIAVVLDGALAEELGRFHLREAAKGEIDLDALLAGQPFKAEQE